MKILNVDQISKKFSRDHHEAVRRGLKDIASMFLGFNSSSTLSGQEFWAVNNVSFEIGRGESLGIMGVNGSGKTTLLKMITGIIRPDKGVISSIGKIVPLFAKGAGFDPVLSGFENININLSLLGLRPTEIKSRIDELIDFSELSADVLSSPVKTYSSGMQARLGFACAVNSRPDILIVDEALAVGDLKFRLKCYQKLNALKRNGASLILVSHSSSTLMANCDKGILLDKGIMKGIGLIDEVVHQYEEMLTISSNKVEAEYPFRNSMSGACIKKIEFLNSIHKADHRLEMSKPAGFHVEIHTNREIKDFILTVLVKDMVANLETILELSNKEDGFSIDLKEGDHQFYIKFPVLNLAPGKYSLKVYISEDYKGNVLDAVENITFIVQSESKPYTSKFFQPRMWSTGV